jgi:RNA binding exosome subunit
LDFSSITVTFLIHATEDAEALMGNIRQELVIKEDEVSFDKIQGYFGNEILSVKAHVIGTRTRSVANALFSKLSKGAREVLFSELEKSTDEHDALYIRIDRQTLGKGEIYLSDEEPIRVKLKPKKRSGGREFMKLQYQELLK